MVVSQDVRNLHLSAKFYSCTNVITCIQLFVLACLDYDFPLNHRIMFYNDVIEIQLVWTRLLSSCLLLFLMKNQKSSEIVSHIVLRVEVAADLPPHDIGCFKEDVSYAMECGVLCEIQCQFTPSHHSAGWLFFHVQSFNWF